MPSVRAGSEPARPEHICQPSVSNQSCSLLASFHTVVPWAQQAYFSQLADLGASRKIKRKEGGWL